MCRWSMDATYIPDEGISHKPTLFFESVMELILIIKIKPWHAGFLVAS